MPESAVKNNWNGVVIYGYVRDVDALATLDLGVHALAAIPQKSNCIRDIGENRCSFVFWVKSQFNLVILSVETNNGIVIARKKLV